MIKKQNARSGEATPEQAAKNTALSNDAISSCLHFSTTNFRRQGVAFYLDFGRKNAVTASRLAEILEIKDVRQVTKLIERERRAGVPICASNDTNPGYYLAESPEELETYIASLNRRSRHLQATILGLGFALDEMRGQGAFWDDENQRRA